MSGTSNLFDIAWFNPMIPLESVSWLDGYLSAGLFSCIAAVNNRIAAHKTRSQVMVVFLFYLFSLISSFLDTIKVNPTIIQRIA